MLSACLVLPFPPSVNSLFINGRYRRAISKTYENWRQEAGWALNRQRPLPALKGWVSIDLALGRPDAQRRDCSNYIKAVEDLIVEHGVIEDDSQVERLTVYWCAETVGCRVYVEPLFKGAAA